VIVLGELARYAVGLRDRLGQHGEQFGSRRGGQLQRLEGVDGGGAGLGATRSLPAVGDGQQPLTRVGRVFVTAPRRADVAASSGPQGDSGVRFCHGGAPSAEVVDEEHSGASTRRCVGGDLLPVGADRLGGLEATDSADVGQWHTDATQPGDQLGTLELGWVVEPVPGLWIHCGRWQHAQLVVQAQRLRGQSRRPRERSDGEQPHVDILLVPATRPARTRLRLPQGSRSSTTAGRTPLRAFLRYAAQRAATHRP
jgi:hypothetical protein